MPSCIHFKESIVSLDASRSALLSSAASGDNETIQSAVKDYEHAVVVAQAAYAKLRDLVSPDELDDTVSQLLGDLAMDEESIGYCNLVPEWTLGVLQRDVAL
jgi:hypothetical protein